MRRQPVRRRILAAYLVALSSGLPGGVAIVDALEPFVGSHVESRHDPGRCHRYHDHAACVQLAHTLALPAAARAVAWHPAAAFLDPTEWADARGSAPPSFLSQPRAPPLFSRSSTA